MQKVVKAFEKNKFQEVRIAISEYQGNDLIDIRTWTLPQEAKEMTRTIATSAKAWFMSPACMAK